MIKSQKIFKLMDKDFGVRFAFHAKDKQDAEHKMKGWLLYQNMYGSREDFWIEETVSEFTIKNIHDDWV